MQKCVTDTYVVYLDALIFFLSTATNNPPGLSLRSAQTNELWGWVCRIEYVQERLNNITKKRRNKNKRRHCVEDKLRTWN